MTTKSFTWQRSTAIMLRRSATSSGSMTVTPIQSGRGHPASVPDMSAVERSGHGSSLWDNDRRQKGVSQRLIGVW